MTHIGYICFYNEQTGNGILTDRYKRVHAFVTLPHLALNSMQFITYQQNGELAEHIIPLEKYAIASLYEENRVLYIQDGAIHGGSLFLTDSSGTRYMLRGAESFIVDRLLRHKSLKPMKTTSVTVNDMTAITKQLMEAVQYVSSHLNEIAHSYRVRIVNIHIPKTGGDDRFYTERRTEIIYRDIYLNKFFLQDEELDRHSAYTDYYCYPFKDGEQLSEEQQGRNSFLHNYNKEEHFATLLLDTLKKENERNIQIKKDNSLFASYWGMTEDPSILFHNLSNCIQYIRKCKVPLESYSGSLSKEHQLLSEFLRDYNNGMVLIK